MPKLALEEVFKRQKKEARRPQSYGSKKSNYSVHEVDENEQP